MKFLFTYEVLGSHTHIRVWVQHPVQLPARSGSLILRNEEFAIFRAMLERVGVKFEAENETH